MRLKLAQPLVNPVDLVAACLGGVGRGFRIDRQMPAVDGLPQTKLLLLHPHQRLRSPLHEAVRAPILG
jgi:hypothetical protein